MPHLRENRAKHKLERGEVVIVAEGQTSPEILDFLGQFGFDAAWIETEHGPFDFADIPDLTRACDLWGMTSVVRVNQHTPGVIYRTLDVGAQGIVVPHVNTADEARAVVQAAKFAPIGARGMYTSRQGHGVADYVARANDETLLVILIEDMVAINDLSEILTVDHIDVFFVAPGDLGQSMGHVGEMDHPEVQATVDAAIAKIVAAGRVAGSLADDSTVEQYIEKGALFFLTSWSGWLEAGARAYLQKVSAASQRL